MAGTFSPSSEWNNASCSKLTNLVEISFSHNYYSCRPWRDVLTVRLNRIEVDLR
jgi:hypothetical protein